MSDGNSAPRTRLGGPSRSPRRRMWQACLVGLFAISVVTVAAADSEEFDAFFIRSGCTVLIAGLLALGLFARPATRVVGAGLGVAAVTAGLLLVAYTAWVVAAIES